MTFTTLLLAALVPLQAADASDRPSAAETRELTRAYLALDALDADGRARQATILARLERLEPLGPRTAEAWRERLVARANEGPRIETGPGLHRLPGGARYAAHGDAEDATGLLVHLHGSSPLQRIPTGPDNRFNAAADERGWFVVWPERADHDAFWSDAANDAAAIEVLDAALRTLDVDRDRVFLSGTSKGAIGCWSIGASHADRFAAIAPVAGGPLPPIHGDGPRDGMIPNLRNLAIVQYQAVGDPRTPVHLTRAARDKIDAARELWGGFDFQYVEVPGTSHGPPEEGLDPVFSRIDDRRRDPRPERVVWQPMRASQRQHHWLWWDAPERGAVIDAELDREANAIRVESGDASGFELLLDDDLVDLERELVVTWNGAEAYRGRPERELATLLKTAARGDAALAFEARVRLERADGG